MKNYIFITGEGNTETPSGEEIDNCQVLGFAKGKDEEDAYKNFLEEYAYLLDTSFDDVIAFELKYAGKKYMGHWKNTKRFSLKEKRG